MKRAVIFLLLLLATGCPDAGQGAATPPGSVTIYCAADREFAQPILERFTAETGIRVDAKWDTEATKTVGLAQAIEAERSRPRADVFWCNEPLQITLLARSGAIAALPSDLAASPRARSDGHWLAFAARVRVLLANTAALSSDRLPAAVADLARAKAHAGIANPLFGTTCAHVAALVATDGEAKARAFLRDLAANPVAVCAGNGDVRQRVASGELAFGLLDTDDAWEAKSSGKPVAIVFPDQAGRGALLLPNGVGIVADAPHADAARKLAAFLVSKPTEEALAKGPGQHVPCIGALDGARPAWIPADLRTWEPDWDAVAAKADLARAIVQQELLGK